MEGLSIAAIVFIVLVVVVLFSALKTVPQGYNWTIERFGRYTHTLMPGLNFVVPFVDRVGRKRLQRLGGTPDQTHASPRAGETYS